MDAWLREIDFLTIRHARSAGQVRPPLYREIGDFRIPLDKPTGVHQAREVGTFFDDYFADNRPKGSVIVLSTPYLRGGETMTNYLSKINSVTISAVHSRPYLGEHRFGDINGLSDEEAMKRQPAYFAARAAAEQKGERHLLAYPGVDKDDVQGESQFNVHRRTNQILVDAKAAYDAGVRTIIINAHGSSGRAAQMNIVGVESSDAAWQEWRRPNNCQVDLIRGGQRTIALFPGFPEPERPARPTTPTPANGKDI